MNGIEKIWFSEGRNEDNIIAYHDSILYRFRGKDLPYNEVKYELSKGRIDNRLTGLPIAYMNSVEYRENDSKLKIQYQKESVDVFTIKDKIKRKEIFDYIRSVKNGEYEVKKPNFFKRTKSPLIALGVVVLGFLFVVMFIQAKKEGTQFEAAGLFAFLLFFAEFGLAKNVIGFSIISFFLLFRIWQTNKKNSEEVHRMKYR